MNWDICFNDIMYHGITQQVTYEFFCKPSSARPWASEVKGNYKK